MADWNCRKKISDYKKLYSKTSTKPNQNNEITNAICWLSVTAFWYRMGFAEVSIDDFTSTINSF